MTLLLMISMPFVKRWQPLYVTPYWPWIVLFFIVVTVVTYFFILKMKKKDNPTKFAHFYMILSVVRPLIYLIFLVIYALCNKADKVPFMLTFLFIYIIFTVFETVALAKKK